MDAEEARTILWKVFDPSLDTTHKFDAPPLENGTLSHSVRIEAPFTCTYEYNPKVMDDVYIGKGTTINNASKVVIGAWTSIGPNFTILTTDFSKEVMVDCKGFTGTRIARNVYIDSKVVIGANALIYPGIGLGRGSKVEPGAIVKEPLGGSQIHRAPGGMRGFRVISCCRPGMTMRNGCTIAHSDGLRTLRTTNSLV
jgi:acetyltransferase-like isoleucine patch superfamily enzyme